MKTSFYQPLLSFCQRFLGELIIIKPDFFLYIYIFFLIQIFFVKMFVLNMYILHFTALCVFNPLDFLSCGGVDCEEQVAGELPVSCRQ